MAKLFHHLSIKHKLLFVMTVTAVSALVLNFFVSLAFTSNNFKTLQESELQSLSDIITDAITPSLLFNDEGSGERLLASLRAKKNIIQAVVFTEGGDTLTSYSKEGVKAETFDYSTLSPQSHCSDKNCVSFQEIRHDGEIVGALLLESDLSTLTSQQLLFTESFAWVFAIAFVFSLVLATVLQRRITHPIISLSELAQKVSHDKDYSLRANVSGRDEVAALGETLNEMLKQIEIQNEELFAAKTLAEDANKSKSEFLANTSHEIRTPINNIIGFAEMLEEHDLGADHQKKVGLIKYSAESLLGIINDILDISKIEAGKMELDPITTDLGDYIRKTLIPLEAQCQNKGINFSMHIDDALPTTVVVDGLRLGQVIINLVNNAIKFTKATGKITFDLTVTEKTAHTVGLNLSVQDSGIGIPKSAQAKIFEAFSQADASTTRQFGGTGLGLSICHQIIKLMGGSIGVESTEGVGSKFFINLVLPLPAVTVEAMNQNTSQERETQKSSENDNQIHVLIVEDNPMSMEIAVHRLKKFGLKVTKARNGQEAFELATAEDFDVIFMDCQMPVMDGFESTGKIREFETGKSRRTPIIALTAHAMEGYRDTCIEAGMDDYITKPIKEDELRKFLEQFTGSKLLVSQAK